MSGFKNITTTPLMEEESKVFNIILEGPFILGVYIDKVLPALKNNQHIHKMNVPRTVYTGLLGLKSAL